MKEQLERKRSVRERDGESLEELKKLIEGERGS